MRKIFEIICNNVSFIHPCTNKGSNKASKAGKKIFVNYEP